MPRKVDLVGRRFGHLTVLRLTEGSSRYSTWECRCDCGNIVDVDSRRLRRGSILSCGKCVHEVSPKRGRKLDDLTGQTFGRLTVIERAPNRDGRVYWKCRCSCGNVTEVSAQNLKLGLATSCGCVPAGSHYRRDLTGQRFGRLVALKPTGESDSQRSVLWLCQCDCGGRKVVSETDLVKGNNRSCGCLRREARQMLVGRLHLEGGTCIEWLGGRRPRRDNASGYPGVFRKKNGSYSVTIGFRKKRYYLGSYENYEDAVEARKLGEERIHKDFLKARELWNSRAEEDPVWAETNPFRFEVVKEKGSLTVQNSMAEFMEEKPRGFQYITAETPTQKRPGTDIGNGYEHQEHKYGQYKNRKYEYREREFRGYKAPEEGRKQTAHDREGASEAEAGGAVGDYAGAEP